MSHVLKLDLYQWCKIPAKELPNHPGLRARFRLVRDSAQMGQLMAQELVQVIEDNNQSNTLKLRHKKKTTHCSWLLPSITSTSSCAISWPIWAESRTRRKRARRSGCAGKSFAGTLHH